MSRQVIEHPAYCPECGGRACIETGPLAVHCGAEHEGGDPCDWRIPLAVRPGASVTLVAVGSSPAAEVNRD